MVHHNGGHGLDGLSDTRPHSDVSVLLLGQTEATAHALCVF